MEVEEEGNWKKVGGGLWSAEHLSDRKPGGKRKTDAKGAEKLNEKSVCVKWWRRLGPNQEPRESVATRHAHTIIYPIQLFQLCSLKNTGGPKNGGEEIHHMRCILCGIGLFDSEVEWTLHFIDWIEIYRFYRSISVISIIYSKCEFSLPSSIRFIIIIIHRFKYRCKHRLNIDCIEVYRIISITWVKGQFSQFRICHHHISINIDYWS